MVPTQIPISKRTATAIVGGFVLVSVATLMACWRRCQSQSLGIGAFRAWLACHELKARRCVLDEGRAATYSFDELAKLLDVSEKRARVSVNRLVAAGLLEWSEFAITFPRPADDFDPGLTDTIGKGRGSFAIPRRMLRFLADGARPALIATVLAFLLRCLSRRRDGFDGWGRVKASWIARVFGIDLRRVKAARVELIALGWIESEPSSQTSENQWGRAFIINLAWARIEKSEGSRLPPPPSASRPPIATPSVNQEPLPEREENQEPCRGRSGVDLKGSGEASKTLPRPTLADVRLEDLKDTGRLLELFALAVVLKLVGPNDADRLKFVGLAEHALAVGKVNPPGLFAYLIRSGLWRYITQIDEDRANARIKAFLRRPEPPPLKASSPIRPPFYPAVQGGLSEDARIVREIRAAMIQAGVFRDPFPMFAARYPDWTRERWDRALAELRL